MKEDDINLATSKISDKKVSKIIATPSFVFFGILFLIAAGLIFYSFFLKVNSSALDSERGKVRSQIETYASKKAKIIIVSERLTAASKIIEARGSLETIISSIVESIPSSFTLSAVNGNHKQISVTVESASLADFATLLSEKVPGIAKTLRLGIKSVRAESFSGSDDAYSISLVFELAGKSK